MKCRRQACGGRIQIRRQRVKQIYSFIYFKSVLWTYCGMHSKQTKCKLSGRHVKIIKFIIIVFTLWVLKCIFWCFNIIQVSDFSTLQQIKEISILTFILNLNMKLLIWKIGCCCFYIFFASGVIIVKRLLAFGREDSCINQKIPLPIWYRRYLEKLPQQKPLVLLQSSDV